MHAEGVNLQEFSAGKYKTMGAYWKPLSKEEGKMIQESVDKIYEQFKEAIQMRRQVADEFMQGQTFDGPEAMWAGLIDGVVEGMEELVG
jgi:ClpP class serine protease